MIINNEEVDKGNFGGYFGQKSYREQRLTGGNEEIRSSDTSKHQQQKTFMKLQNINNKKKNIYETSKH